MKKANAPLESAEPGAPQLILIAIGLIDTALDKINRPAAQRSEDLHSVRVTIKRLRAILRLIRPVISKVAFTRENAHLRKAARRLAFSRDTTIARKTLDALSRSVSRPDRLKAFGAALASFDEQAVPISAINKAMKQVGRDLQQSARRLERLRIAQPGWKAVGPGLCKVYSQARRRMVAALQTDDDDSYHRWRTRVKNLYHELRMLAPDASKQFGPLIACLKELESNLGSNQDIAMVITLLKKNPDAYGGTKNVGKVLKSLDKQSKKLRRKSRSLGKVIFAKKR